MQRSNWTRISEPAAWASYFWYPETQTPLPASSNSRACSANSLAAALYVASHLPRATLRRYHTLFAEAKSKLFFCCMFFGY